MTVVSSTGALILISAPSGAGKTSLVNAILERDPKLVVSVSHTTRPMRPGETDGVNYHFVGTTKFQAMVEQHQFLEHALVFGNQYGTALSTVNDLRAQGRDVILEIDWQGAKQVRTMVQECVSIFILPPSEDALLLRLNKRGQDSQATIERRFAEAKLDMSQAGDYQYIVVNDDFERACDELMSIITSMRLTAARQCGENPVVRDLTSGQ